MFLKIVLMFFTTVAAALGKNYLVDTVDLPAGGMGLTGMQQSMLFFPYDNVIISRKVCCCWHVRLEF
jgi:hypothetical protein